MEILFEVLDYNEVFTNALIGKCSIGLSTLYRKPHHEEYKVWLALTNPDQGKGTKN